MITADVRRAIRQAAAEAAAAGQLPALEAGPGMPADPSTLRPVSPARGGGPGRYASTMPHVLGVAGRLQPGRAAATLAARLAPLPWIAAVTTAAGYLTVTVTDEALADLAVRVPAVPDCAASDILRGLTVPAPAAGHDLAGARTWQHARDVLAAEVTAGLAARSGAQIAGDPSPERLAPSRPPASAPAAPVSAALAWAGSDAVRYALIRRAGGRPCGATVRVPVRYHLGNPVYAIRYAHAHAACTLRQAADLGLGTGEAAAFVPRLLAHPAERALLDSLSWLPERVAWAARAGQPGEFARYLEGLAGAYHDCREHCPALPFGGRAAPCGRDARRARLWLVTAARTAIAAGLGLLGISAPDRL